MKEFVLIFVTFLFSVHCHSQEYQIQARVVDSVNFQEIPFVTVYGSPSWGTITDDLGFFRLQVPEENLDDSLYFTCVGYRPVAVRARDIDPSSLDTVFLHQHLVELDAVEVSAQFRKAPGSKKIIRRAIESIPRNYPDYQALYKGYYREYIKQDDEYINLLETIIQLEDRGISAHDDFSAGILYKRFRPEFEINADLMRPYDNINKTIPYSIAPTKTGNELVLLRSHDPVRNYDRPALYYIDNLKSSFISNHVFNAPKLTYLNDRPYYRIGFRNKRDRKLGDAKVFATGAIFIDGLNYGIKRINYITYAETPENRKKVFELNLEYITEGEKYHLNYISFNNLFNTRNFVVSNVRFDQDAVLVTFNRPYNPEAALEKDNYKIYWKGQKMLIKEIELDNTVDRIRVVLLEGNMIRDELLDKNLNNNIGRGRVVYHNDRYLAENLDIEILNLRDMQGNPLMSQEFNDYYQYREFFVKDHSRELSNQSGNLINKTLPVVETEISGTMTEDTSWLNTPLISEETRTRTINVGNRIMHSALEGMYRNDEKKKTEVLYIHTDREVYAPQDTLWFKAYIRNRADLTGSDYSQTLYLNLVNASGDIVKKERFYINGSDARGQIRLDPQLEEGVYYLTAYSSWMMNFKPDDVFSRQILVKKDIRDGYQMVVSYDKKTFFPGDTVKIFVFCYDDTEKEVDNIGFSYRLVSDRQVLHRGRSNTSISGTEPLTFVVPPDISEMPSIRLDANHRDQLLDTVYSLPVNYDVSVNFYPEGGHLINGLKSRVAFKAQSPTREPVEIQGNIIDAEGKTVRQIHSEHDGMGIFEFTAEKDHRYSLRLSSPPGIQKTFALPEGKDSGWQLRGEIREGSIHLNIRRKNTQSDSALILVRIREYNKYYKEIRVDRRENMVIPTENFPPGIAVVTLFDHKMIPRAEIIIRIPSPEGIKATMKSGRRDYIPRDETSLNIDLSSRIPVSFNGSYSLSVIDDELCSEEFIDDPDIRYSFLVSPEIKGRINNPAYYMQTGDKRISFHLDLLLLTQGWRDYENLEYVDPDQDLPEPLNRDIVSGRLVKQLLDRNDEPVDGFLQVYYMGVNKAVPVKEDGRFFFYPVYRPGYRNSLFLTALDEKGGDNVMIRLDTVPFQRNFRGYLKDYASGMKEDSGIPVLTYENITDKFSLGLRNHQWIEEVKILGRMRNEFEYFESSLLNARTPGKLSLENSLGPYEILMNMGLPVREFYPLGTDSIVQPMEVEYNSYPWDEYGNPARIMWLVDNMPWEYRSVRTLDPRDIETLFLILFPETQNLAMYRIDEMGNIRTPNVVVSVHLRTDTEGEATMNKLNTLISPNFTIAKKFYEPVYDSGEARSSQIPDLRKTIHWEPDLKINDDGTATVRFYNGDRYTRIKCILEGITENGIPVYSEYFYNVSLMRE